MEPQTLPNEARVRMEEALNILRSKGALRDNKCPSCNTEMWNVDFIAIPSNPLPRFGTPPTGIVFTLGTPSPSGYIPALSLACSNCGYTKFYNLNILGLVGK